MIGKKQEFKDELTGKVVEGIAIWQEQDGTNYVDIRFNDNTSFHIALGATLVLSSAELQDWSKDGFAEDSEVTIVRKFV